METFVIKVHSDDARKINDYLNNVCEVKVIHEFVNNTGITHFVLTTHRSTFNLVKDLLFEDHIQFIEL